MLNVGTPELLVILVVALLVLGPNKLPEVARKLGKAVGEIRRLGEGFQAEMRDALHEPVKMDPVEQESDPVPATDAGATDAVVATVDAPPEPAEPIEGDGDPTAT